MTWLRISNVKVVITWCTVSVGHSTAAPALIASHARPCGTAVTAGGAHILLKSFVSCQQENPFHNPNVDGRVSGNLVWHTL